MIDRYTKVLLTVIAVNLTILGGWAVSKAVVPEVHAAGMSGPVAVVGTGGWIFLFSSDGKDVCWWNVDNYEKHLPERKWTSLGCER